ncbi:hypothetical protein C8Q75DRAFT_806373 [Abortiporus biennis]|nr:hypothetical protein C8Q75DRAFT_806373 [Abortiporus biennis]
MPPPATPETLRDEDSILPPADPTNLDLLFDFKGVFQQNPSIAARYLHDAWRDTHPQLQIVITTIIRLISETRPLSGNSALQEYLSSDLLEVASNIALDEKLYDFELTMYTDEENTMAIDYCTGVLVIIAMCVSMSLIESQVERVQNIIRPTVIKFLKKLPKLVEVLWNHRSLIRDPYGDKIQSTMHHIFTVSSGQEPKRATIGWNMVNVSEMSMDLHKYYCRLGYGTEISWPPPLSSKYLHLYFYALIYERRTQIDGKENHLVIMFRSFSELLIESCGSFAGDDVFVTVGGVLQDLISSDESRNLVAPFDVQKKFIQLLRSPDLANNKTTFQQLLIIIRLFTKLCPDIYRSKDTRNATEGQENLTKQPSLAYSLLQGATMQSCSQDISDGELSHRIFSVFSILDDLLEDDEIGEDTWSECITKFEELRILPLLTQMLSIEIRSGRGQGHSYEFAVEMQDKFMERIAGAGPDDIQADLDTFCRIIRREYRKFLVALQRAPNPSPEKVQHWRDMAQRVGLSLDADEENSTNEVVTIKACSSKDCICFGGKTNHCLQICTGCKKVAYCNAKCQRKDWSEHKKTCTKLRST